MEDNGKLRAVRLAWGWSQDRLATRLGCTRSLVSAMELGRTPVMPAVWELLGLDGPPDTIAVVPEGLRAYGRRSPGNKVQVVLSDEAAAIWRRWVADGQGSASERVSALIEAVGDD